MKEQLMRQIIAKQEELEKMRVSQLANIHARNYYNSHDEEERLLSEYFELNNRIKIAIKDVADLNEQLKQAEVESEVAEIKSTPIPSGWICPRCQKVHNWMVQHCDCLPNVITASTTEPIKELMPCDKCRYDGLQQYPETCNDCGGTEFSPLI